MIDSVVNFFFYAKHLPQWLIAPGQGYPFDLVCVCSLPNFFGVIFHFLIIGILIKILLKSRDIRSDRFFTFLTLGVFLSAVSKILDWYMNMRSATGAFNGVYFSYPIDVTLGIFQLVGTIIILYAIISKLFYVHHERQESSTNEV